MRKVKIITDSCSDLKSELLEKYDIDYGRMSTVEDGVVSPALLTWSNEDAHALYEKLREGKRITTTQVPVEEFNRIFTKYLDEGCDIVYIGCSSKQSGSVNTGFVAAKKLLETHPEAKIYSIDSLNASMGEGMLAIEAAKYAATGKSADEVRDYVLSIRKKIQQFVTVHTLDYLKRSGRVSASSAFFGNLMGIKPVLISDKNGVQVAYKKVKGRKNSFREIVNLLKENALDVENQTVYVAHADCQKEEIDELVELVKTELKPKAVEVEMIGPIIGASTGPDTVGIWALGKEVTYSAEEK